jgi:uncharacterized protein YndB with AHSA1/START domain
MPATQPETAALDTELEITRTFDAPREIVFKAWTNPEHMKQWWGPKGFAWVKCTMDLRPGGIFHYCVRSPDGHEMWGIFKYREIVSPERLVLTNSFSDDKANVVRAPWSPSWPLEILNTITFIEHHSKTTLKMHGTPYNASEEELKAFAAGKGSMQQGFAGTLDALTAYLSSLPHP